MRSIAKKKILKLNDIPENYIKIASGLGEANAQSLLIIPLSIDEIVYGMIEIARFEPFKEIEIQFIEKIAQNIANNLNNVRMNDQNLDLISKFQEQAQLMKEKEEEMSQNLEEMEEIREKYEKLKKKNSKA